MAMIHRCSPTRCNDCGQHSRQYQPAQYHRGHQVYVHARNDVVRVEHFIGPGTTGRAAASIVYENCRRPKFRFGGGQTS
jgi:hypothetical protein